MMDRGGIDVVAYLLISLCEHYLRGGRKRQRTRGLKRNRQMWLIVFATIEWL